MLRFCFLHNMFVFIFVISAVFTEGQTTCPYTVIGNTINCTSFSYDRGQLGVKGIQLVDQYENRVQLRGVSSNNLQLSPECITKSTLTHLVGVWGINVFRAAIHIDEWENGYKVNPAYYDDFIVNIVQWCKELGLYVILDWHVIGDPNAHMDAWYQPTSGLALDFFEKYSLLYKDETHVLYEIANEPNNVNWDSLVWYHNVIIDTIRVNAPDAIIIAGTPEFSQELDKPHARRVDNTHNVLYAFHFNAGVDDDLYSFFDWYVDRLPLFVSQWGVSDDVLGTSGEYNISVAEKYLDLCARLGEESTTATVVSWVQWSYTDMDSTPVSLLETGSCSAGRWWGTTCPGKFTENYFRSRAHDDDSLDCNVEVFIPSSNDDDGELEVGYIFLIIFLCVGVIMTAVYFYSARKTMLANRAQEAALKEQFPKKLGKVEFGALSTNEPPSSSPTKKGKNHSPISSPPKTTAHTTAVEKGRTDDGGDMDLSNIYTSEDNSSFSGSSKESILKDPTRQDSTSSYTSNSVASGSFNPPLPPSSNSSQHNSTSPGSPTPSMSSAESSSSALLKHQQSRRHSPPRRQASASPPRRQPSARSGSPHNSPPPGTIDHGVSMRSNKKTPTRNTRKLKNF